MYLRDFAARCGALHVASACYHRTHSDTTASFLVRMVVFSRDNQEELAFVTACVKQQPLSAPRTCKSRPGSQGGIVVKCCALDCMSEEPGAIASVSVAEEDAVSVACHSWKLSYVCGHDDTEFFLVCLVVPRALLAAAAPFTMDRCSIGGPWWFTEP